jgi:hypothetical protein
VPIELPPSPEPIIPLSPVSTRPVSAVGSSVFADFDGEASARRQSEPQIPVQAAAIPKKTASFRDRLLLRRSIIESPEADGHKAKRRRSLGLQLSLSSAFLRLGYKAGEEVEPEKLPEERDEDAIADIVGYIRSGTSTPVPAPAPVLYMPPTAASSVYSMDTRETEPGMSSFYSSEDDENDEVATPTDLAPTPRSYPKYYNFDEIKPEAREVQKQEVVRPLGFLREQVVGELQWRDEMVGELGYLRGVVV